MTPEEHIVLASIMGLLVVGYLLRSLTILFLLIHKALMEKKDA